jgi:hypothetical protein
LSRGNDNTPTRQQASPSPAKNASCSQLFPMFVPSLSWHNHHFYIKMF